MNVARGYVLVAVAIVAAASQSATAAVPADMGAVARAKKGAGRLEVRVAGLPKGQQSNVVLTGPGGLRRAVPTKGLVLKTARVGSYKLTTSPVTFRRASGPIRKGAIARPSRRVLKARVKAGKRTKLEAKYGSIVNPGVKALKSKVLSVVGAPANPSAVTLKGRQSLARGAILSLPPSEPLPRGLLSRVLAVSYRAGKTMVSLRAASPYEVAPVYEFDVPATATESASGSAFKAGCGAPSGVSPYRRIKNISISGGWNTLRVLRQDIPIGVRVMAHFTAEAGVDVVGGLGLECSLKASVSANGMAGPIPVTAGLEGELTAFAGVGGKLSTGGSIRVDAGAATIGTPPAPVWLPDVSFSNPKFSFKAEQFAEARGGIGVGVKLGIGNDYIASATVKVGANLNLTARPGSCSWDARFGQFSAGGKVLNWDIETPKTPALFTKNLWRGCRGGSSGASGGGGSSSGSGQDPRPGGGDPGAGDSGMVTPGFGTGPLAWSSPIEVNHQQPFTKSSEFAGVDCPSQELCVAYDGQGNLLVSRSPGVPGSWRLVRIPVAASAAIGAVSCPSTRLCLAASGLGLFASTNLDGGSPAWKDVSPVTGSVSAVSCPSVSLCVGIAREAIVTSQDPSGAPGSWQVSPLAGIGSRTPMHLTCPTVTLCVAVNGTGEILVSGNPAGGGASWRKDDLGTTSAIQSVSCPSRSLCVLVDGNGRFLVSSNPLQGPASWQATSFFPTPSGLAPYQVSCASASLCVAGGDIFGRIFVSTDPLSGTWRSYVDFDTTWLGGLSCPSENFCIGASFTGEILQAAHLGSEDAPWEEVAAEGYNEITGVSCPSTSFCVAVNSAGDVMVSADDELSSWRTIKGLSQPDRYISLRSVSCPSSSLCIAVDAGSIYVTNDPAGPIGGWTKTPPYQHGVSLTDVSCPSVSLCLATTADGGVLVSTEPARDDAWMLRRVPGAGNLTGISCPTVEYCVAVDGGGRVITSANPASPTSIWTSGQVNPYTYTLNGRSTNYGFAAVSCPSLTLCVAVGPSGGLATSFNPPGGPGSWSAGMLFGIGDLTDVDCPSVSLCVASVGVGWNAGSVLTSSNPSGGIRTWTTAWVDDAPFSGLTQVECPSAARCLAADRYGNVLIGSS